MSAKSVPKWRERTGTNGNGSLPSVFVPPRRGYGTKERSGNEAKARHVEIVEDSGVITCAHGGQKALGVAAGFWVLEADWFGKHMEPNPGRGSSPRAAMPNRKVPVRPVMGGTSVWDFLRALAMLACLAGAGMILLSISGAWDDYRQSRHPSRWGRAATAYERLAANGLVAMNCRAPRASDLNMFLVVEAARASDHRDFTVESVSMPKAEVRSDRFRVVSLQGNVLEARRSKPWSTVEHDDEITQIQLVGDATEVRLWVATGKVPSAPSAQSRKRLWEFVDEIRDSEARAIHRLGVEAPAAAAKITAGMLAGIFVLGFVFQLA